MPCLTKKQRNKMKRKQIRPAPNVLDRLGLIANSPSVSKMDPDITVAKSSTYNFSTFAPDLSASAAAQDDVCDVCEEKSPKSPDEIRVSAGKQNTLSEHGTSMFPSVIGVGLPIASSDQHNSNDRLDPLANMDAFIFDSDEEVNTIQAPWPTPSVTPPMSPPKTAMMESVSRSLSLITLGDAFPCEDDSESVNHEEELSGDKGKDKAPVDPASLYQTDSQEDMSIDQREEDISIDQQEHMPIDQHEEMLDTSFIPSTQSNNTSNASHYEAENALDEGLTALKVQTKPEHGNDEVSYLHASEALDVKDDINKDNNTEVKALTPKDETEVLYGETLAKNLSIPELSTQQDKIQLDPEQAMSVDIHEDTVPTVLDHTISGEDSVISEGSNHSYITADLNPPPSSTASDSQIGHTPCHGHSRLIRYNSTEKQDSLPYKIANALTTTALAPVSAIGQLSRPEQCNLLDLLQKILHKSDENRHFLQLRRTQSEPTPPTTSAVVVTKKSGISLSLYNGYYGWMPSPASSTTALT